MIYNELDLQLDIDLTTDGSAIVPVEFDIKQLVTHTHQNNELLSVYLDVVKSFLGEWMFKVNEIGVSQDVNTTGGMFISQLAELVGLDLYNRPEVSLQDKKSQLVTAVESLRTKGTYKQLENVLRGMGIVVEIQDMFANSEASYNDFDQHIISEWFVGENPAELAGYFKTPHFYVTIMLTTLYNPGLVESLWNSIQEERLNSVLDYNIPINTWPVLNLLLTFKKDLNRGSLSTTNPNIFSSYIDNRPEKNFKLNTAGLNATVVVDNDGIPIWANDGLEVFNGFAPWRLNDDLNLNYSIVQSRLLPKKFLLGAGNKKRVLLYDSFSDVDGTQWVNHDPEINTPSYKVRHTGLATGTMIYNNELVMYATGILNQRGIYLDLGRDNVLLSFKIWFWDYAGQRAYSGGCIFRRAINTNTYMKVSLRHGYAVNTSELAAYISVSGVDTLIFSHVFDTPVEEGWHSIDINVRGLFIDIWFNGVLLADNIDMGDPSVLLGTAYGTYFSFIAEGMEFFDRRIKFKDLRILDLGNQDQEYMFNEKADVLVDSFTNVSTASVNGHVPDIVLYNSVWVDQYNLLKGDASHISKVLLQISDDPDTSGKYTTTSYVDLGEVDIKISFNYNTNFYIGAQKRDLVKGCNILYNPNSGYGENIKVIMDYETDFTGEFRVSYCINDTEVNVLASTPLLSTDVTNTLTLFSNPRDVNITVVIQDDKITAVFNKVRTLEVYDYKNRGNFGSCFGFYVPYIAGVVVYGYFFDLHVSRIGLEGAKNVTSIVPTLKNTFQGEALTALSDYVPDVNNTGSIWYDPMNCFMLSGDGHLRAGSGAGSEILTSYISVGNDHMDVTFMLDASTPGTLQAGLYLLRNRQTGKSLRIVSNRFGSGNVYLTLHDVFGDITTGEYSSSLFGLSSTVGALGFRIKLDKIYNYYNPLDFTLPFRRGGTVYRGSVWIYYESVLGTIGSQVSEVIIPDNGYGSDMSIYYDMYTSAGVRISEITVHPTLVTSAVRADVQRYVGDVECVDNGSSFDVSMEVPVNEQMDKASEIALFAADGRTLVGGVTFPSLDVNLSEKLTIEGEIEYS